MKLVFEEGSMYFNSKYPDRYMLVYEATKAKTQTTIQGVWVLKETFEIMTPMRIHINNNDYKEWKEID